MNHWTSLRWTARTLWRPCTAALVVLLASTVVTALLAASAPLATQHVLASTTAGHSSTLWLALLLAALTVPALLTTCQRLAQAPIDRTLTAQGDHVVIDLGGSLPDLGLIDQRDFRERLWESSASIDRATKTHQHLLQAVSALTGTLALLATVATLGWYVPPLLLLTAIPNTIVQARSQRLRFNSDLRQVPLQQEAWYCLWAAGQPHMAREIRTFGLGRWLVQRHDHYARQAARDQLRTTATNTIATTAVSIAYSAVVGLALLIGSRGASTAGQLTLLVTATIAVSRSINQLAASATMTVQSLDAVTRLRTLVDQAAPTIALSPDGAHAPTRWNDGLTLTDVTFSYGQEPVLDHLHLHIPAGKVVALVGENGHGKSTLVRLLTRMNDPQTGTITLDGRPLADYDLHSYRDTIATVFQDHSRFRMTVKENIAFGDPLLIAAPQDLGIEARIHEALHAGGAARIVASYPEGLAAELGTQLGGHEPSGGEWQRLATARAFYPDASFVILDEPTSALDADAERHLFDSFATLVAGRTALMISHRFSTVRQADLIAVLHNGRITELGTHEELMNLRGRYHQLFTVQAQRYQTTAGTAPGLVGDCPGFG